MTNLTSDHFWRFCFSLCFALSYHELGAFGQAKRGADENGQPQIILALSGSEPGDDVFKYSLVPDERKMKFENAVKHYKSAHLALLDCRKDLPNHPIYENLDDIYDIGFEIQRLTPTKLNLLKQWIAIHESVFIELEHVEFCEYAKWNIELANMFDPNRQTDMQIAKQCREFVRLLMMRTRIAIHEKRYQDAARNIRLQLKITKDVGQANGMLTTLISIASETNPYSTITEWIAQPDSPNLYWSLKRLPKSLNQCDAAVRNEILFIRSGLDSPLFDESQWETRTPSDWNKLFYREFQRVMSFAGGQSKTNKQDNSLLAFAFVLKQYPAAKRKLRAMGWKPEVIDKMPVTKVAVIYQKQLLMELTNPILQATLIDDMDEQNAAINAAEQKLTSSADSLDQTEIIPLVALTMPTIRQVLKAKHRPLIRRRSLLTLEATRIFLAKHKRLPRSADELLSLNIGGLKSALRHIQWKTSNGQLMLKEQLKNHKLFGLNQYELSIQKQ